ncbi:putative hemolysin [Lysobacter sp. CA196]|uniref:putative hemolysin n=1 Tax=Lysobacter sp. CA196 TaxID=3455606 RepID=UPI003F8D3CE4
MIELYGLLLAARLPVDMNILINQSSSSRRFRMKFNYQYVVACVVAVALASCVNALDKGKKSEGTELVPRVGVANPASVHCVKLGGKLETRKDKDGGEYGMCKLPDGRKCEEWSLFRDAKCVDGAAE